MEIDGGVLDFCAAKEFVRSDAAVIVFRVHQAVSAAIRSRDQGRRHQFFLGRSFKVRLERLQDPESNPSILRPGSRREQEWAT